MTVAEKSYNLQNRH